MNKILCIESHIDDLTLCAGGTIAKLIEKGHDVTVLCLSQNYEKGNLKHEWNAAMDVLNPTKRIIKDFKVREFQKQRQEILQLFCDLKKDYDTVITHSANDLHQDHKTVGQESLNAFKDINLITYTGVWNNRAATRNYFIKLKHKHINIKWRAVKCFESQKEKPYCKHDFVHALAKVEGVIAANSNYAESFYTINITK